MARPFKDLTTAYDAADEAQSCLVAKTSSERRTLLNHAGIDDLVSPHPHLYTRRDVWEGLSPNQRAIWMINGLASLHPQWLFCKAAAALMHGLRVPYAEARFIDVYIRSDAESFRKKQDGNSAPQAWPVPTIRFCRLPDSGHSSPIRISGVRVTPLDDTVCDCLRAWGFTSGLIVADSYLARTKQDRGALLRLLEPYAGCKGMADARIIASYADGRSESGGESFTRARIIELGYAIPELQVWFASPLDGRRMRADFVWTAASGARIIGEYDGLDKYQDPAMTKGRSAVELLVMQNLRDNPLALFGRVMHLTKWTVASDEALCALLDAYGVPRAPDAWTTQARPKSRVRRGLRARILDLDGIQTWCYTVDGPACRGVEPPR